MNHNTLISPDNYWLIWFVLFGIALFGFWAEKTKIGSKISGAMIAILGGFLFSNLNILPVNTKAYDITWSYLVPLAIPLLLFKANLKKIFKEAGPTLFAFILGAIGSVIGTILAFKLVSLGNEGWKIAGIFCATYVGGSMNYVAVANALQLKSADLLTAGIAADNLMMTVYFFILFILPEISVIQKFFKKRENLPVDEKKFEYLNDNNMGLWDIMLALTISFGLAAISFSIENALGMKGSGILILTALTVFLASVFSSLFENIKGSSELGTILMQIFFAVIGASANIKTVISVGPVLFVFATIILSTHLFFILLTGKLFGLDLKEILIASNANMGGPTTSAAMAVAKKWNSLILPAILSGTFGYAIANFVGVFVANWIK